MPTLASSSSVLALCRELIRIPSPSGQEGALGSFVAERMQALGFGVEIDRYGDVLGIRWGRRPGRTLLLDAHLDTVPVTDPDSWTHAPFGAELAQGRLWGRGATDTKGSLAAMIQAAADLSSEDFGGTVIVSASVCEESLTAAALDHVLESHPADIVLVGEPTSLRLGTAQKGRAGLVVETCGRSVHSSRPELGENAVYKMMEAIARIRALPLPADPELGTGICELIEIESEPRPSVGMVPHHCTARLALRVLPGETAAAVLGRIVQCLEGLAGARVDYCQLSQMCSRGLELSMREFIPAWKNPHAELEKQLLLVLGSEPFAAPYTTNASAAATRGIPTFLLGPGSIEQAHTVDEWIDPQELEEAVRAYTGVIRTCLRG